jgi:hypothetical protein
LRYPVAPRARLTYIKTKLIFGGDRV